MVSSVDPMTVRSFAFHPDRLFDLFGGMLVTGPFDVIKIEGHAEQRLPYDEDIVDCSNRMFEFTTALMMADMAGEFYALPSRRWRNFRSGKDITMRDFPDAAHPLLFLGNPIRIVKDTHGIHVHVPPEYRVKSGMELGY